MLETLIIRHIALIDEVRIQFHEGMQVLSGETGAGKSIVVDSVNLILGGRADRDLIRAGYEKASVEAVFVTGNNQNVDHFMETEGIDYDGQSLTIYREISANGKNICRICGVMVPVSRLKDLAVYLMDLHGQSEHQFLTDPESQLVFLDTTGGPEHEALLRKIRNDYECFIDNHREYARLVKKNENRESRIRALEHELAELRKANIRPGEIRALAEERKQLAEAEKQHKVFQRIHDLLSGDEDGASGLSRVQEASETLKMLAESDDHFNDISKSCEALYYELEEIAYQVSLMSERSDFDNNALEKTDARLDLIHRLERKYGKDADEIPALLQALEEEYSQMIDLEDKIRKMSAEHKRLLGVYRNTARELTASRRELSVDFEKRMMKELGDLGMGSTQFRVEFFPNESGKPLMPTPLGDDRIGFMISPNPGEPLKPLAKIASGGELSRLMLAVKTLESKHSGVESMVFDEIDTGISGRMAQVVAEKMIMISRERQVICVTHLPQIAAAADYQYLVQKARSGERTVTCVTELDTDGRIGEVGRMISGAEGMTEESCTYASSMIKAAKQIKSIQK